jgi:hypothetical protein
MFREICDGFTAGSSHSLDCHLETTFGLGGTLKQNEGSRGIQFHIAARKEGSTPSVCEEKKMTAIPRAKPKGDLCINLKEIDLQRSKQASRRID